MVKGKFIWLQAFFIWRWNDYDSFRFYTFLRPEGWEWLVKKTICAPRWNRMHKLCWWLNLKIVLSHWIFWIDFPTCQTIDNPYFMSRALRYPLDTLVPILVFQHGHGFASMMLATLRSLRLQQRHSEKWMKGKNQLKKPLLHQNVGKRT